jgi:hypothetical protein
MRIGGQLSGLHACSLRGVYETEGVADEFDGWYDLRLLAGERGKVFISQSCDA